MISEADINLDPLVLHKAFVFAPYINSTVRFRSVQAAQIPVVGKSFGTLAQMRISALPAKDFVLSTPFSDLIWFSHALRVM
jgi:hypothetical protein